VICTLFILGHIFTFKHLCLHSITKILRNGPKAHFPFRWTLRSEAVSDELRSYHIFIWRQYCSHGEIFRHGSQECCTNLVLLSSARNNHIMAEDEGHVDHQFPRVSDEAGYCSSFVPVHARSRRIPSGVCPKILASEGTSANSTQ
jgi:hypothetical protein